MSQQSLFMMLLVVIWISTYSFVNISSRDTLFREISWLEYRGLISSSEVLITNKEDALSTLVNEIRSSEDKGTSVQSSVSGATFTLTVNVYNVDRMPLPGSGGSIYVVLYNSTWSPIYYKNVDFIGGQSFTSISFDGLQPGVYIIEVYQKPSVSGLLVEFWGSKRISISSNMSFDFVRSSPYLQGIYPHGGLILKPGLVSPYVLVKNVETVDLSVFVELKILSLTGVLLYNTNSTQIKVSAGSIYNLTLTSISLSQGIYRFIYIVWTDYQEAEKHAVTDQCDIAYIVVSTASPTVVKLSPLDVFELDFSREGVDVDGDGFREAIFEILVPPVTANTWMDITVSMHYGRGKVDAALLSPIPTNFVIENRTSYVIFRIPGILSRTYRLIIIEKEKDSFIRVMIPIYRVEDQLIIPIPGIGAPAKWDAILLHITIDEKGFSPAIWEISPQIVEVNPGEEFDLRINFTIRQFSYFPPGIIWQVYLVYSWSPIWPPTEGYYVPLYDGTPSYSGVNVVKTIRVRAPSTPGEHYIWVSMCQHYGMDLAIEGVRSPQLPAHVKVIVKTPKLVSTPAPFPISTPTPTSIPYFGKSVEVDVSHSYDISSSTLTFRVLVTNKGGSDARFQLGAGFSESLFNLTEGFPRPPYIGDISELGGSPPDYRNQILKPSESREYVFHVNVEEFVKKNYLNKPLYFIVIVWEEFGDKIYTYKFYDFRITLPYNTTTPIYTQTIKFPTQTETVTKTLLDSIDIGVKMPDYILVNGTGIIEVSITNKGNVLADIAIEIRSMYGHLEVVQPAEGYILKIPPGRTRTLSVTIRGSREGEEILIVTVSTSGASDMIIRTIRIPVTRLRTVYINLYVSFRIPFIEFYRRSETAEVYICNTLASRIRDNLYVAEIPSIYSVCLVNVEKSVIGIRWSPYKERILVTDTIELVVPDITLSLSQTVLAWILFIPLGIGLNKLYYKRVYYSVSASMVSFLFIITFITLWFPEMFLMFYFIIIEILTMLIMGINLVTKKIRLLVTPRKTPTKERTKKEIKEDEEKTLEEDEKLSKRLSKLLQSILKEHVPEPHKKKTYIETITVPEWVREFLKKVGNELPNEMYLIGCGSWGCIYACGNYAIKVPLGLRDVIKSGSKIFPTLKEGLVREIMKEVEVLSGLDHDNILKLVDYSINPPMLVYELADGSLEDYEKLDLRNMLLISIQICEALRYLHSRGVVHGDLKPSNILVAKGFVKIGDFSSMTHLLRTFSKSSKATTCTPGYCAPEQLFIDLKEDKRRKGCENRVDIYQLANVILFMMDLAPLDGSMWSTEEVNKRVRNIDIEELRSLLIDMLSKEPWLRPNAEDVEKKLLDILRRYVKEKD